MLHVNQPHLVPDSDRGLPEPEFISPKQLYAAIEGFVRRQYPVIAFALLLTLGLGAVYLSTTPPKYTSQAVLLIDAHKTQLFQPSQQTIGDFPLDSMSSAVAFTSTSAVIPEPTFRFLSNCKMISAM